MNPLGDGRPGDGILDDLIHAAARQGVELAGRPPAMGEEDPVSGPIHRAALNQALQPAEQGGGRGTSRRRLHLPITRRYAWRPERWTSSGVSVVSSSSLRPQSPKMRMISLSRSPSTAFSSRSISSRLSTSRSGRGHIGSCGFARTSSPLRERPR